MNTRLSPTSFAFRTAQIVARPATAADESLFRRCYSDAETMRFIGAPLPETIAGERFRDVLRMMYASPLAWLLLAVDENDSGETIGLCGVPHFDARAPRLEIGIVLSGSARGKGYSAQVLRGLSARLFALLPVDTLYLNYDPRNVPLDRAAASAGYSKAVEIAEARSRHFCRTAQRFLLSCGANVH